MSCHPQCERSEDPLDQISGHVAQVVLNKFSDVHKGIYLNKPAALHESPGLVKSPWSKQINL